MTDKQFLIDINPEIELPKYELVLTKLNGEPLQELYNIEDLEIRAYFANIDEISFRVPFYRTENDGTQVKNELYDLVDGSMMVLVNDMKYFILTKPEIKTNEQTGEIYKSILGFSREYEFGQKILSGYEGVSRKIYDHTNSVDENGTPIGFLNYIEERTSWRIGYINANLLLKFRYLSFPKSTFLQAMAEVQKTFECVFQYDTINKTIDVYEISQLGHDRGLYISDRNFINSLTQTINHDEIKTRLYLYGKDNISIQSINITGQPYIENFNFFKNTNYMTQDLIDALNTYDDYVVTKEGEYNGYLSQLETYNSTLSTKEIELRTLQTELKVIQSNLDVAIADNQPTATLKNQETAKINQINTKQNEINTVKSQINTVYNNINTLKSQINKSNHFTQEQLKELDVFIREDEFSDSNYTEDNLEELLESGKKVLAKISYPTLQFNVDVEDFLSLVEGQHMWDKFILGDLVTLEHEELGFDIQVRLVGYTHNPDNNTLNLIFSNRDSVDDANIYLKDLLENLTTTSSTVDFSRFKWDKGEDVSNEFAKYIRNQLDLSKQAILKAEGQKPVLDERGLWLYKENPDGSIDPRQIRAINNVIALTQDNWNTVDVSITPDGIVAAKLIGQIILGSNLKIVSDNGIVEILQNLISIKDNQGRLRVALGNYATNKYGLLIKDSTGNKTILDEDGILQTWQEGRTDNIDTGKPLRLSVFIPSGTRVINKAILRFKRENFRAYSQTTHSEPSRTTSQSSTSSSGSSSTISAGASTSSTTSSGAENVAITNIVYYPNPTYDLWTTYELQGENMHSHGVAFHGHTVSVSGHVHNMDHTHNIQHWHDISHTHTTPSHSHDILYGIYESTKSSNINIVINGTNRTLALSGGVGFNSDQSNLNITQYLTVGQWNTIDIGGTGLGRIDATVFIQALMNIE